MSSMTRLSLLSSSSSRLHSLVCHMYHYKHDSGNTDGRFGVTVILANTVSIAHICLTAI